MQESFWTHLEALVTSAELVIERPRGATHPRHPALVYPLDYGYLKGTSGGDGSAIDGWRGSLAEGHLEAGVCTVDLEKREAEIKLLLGCPPAEQQIICAFHQSAWTAALVVERWPLSPLVPLEQALDSGAGTR